jgi:DNA-binding NarL/FixJ family response regulator
VVRRLRECDPRGDVIVLTTYDTDEEISGAQAGAKAYVLKDISADDLVACISRRAGRQDVSRSRCRVEA